MRMVKRMRAWRLSSSQMATELVEIRLPSVEKFATRLATELSVDAAGFEQLLDLEDRRQ